ncbi:hypothetical protein D3C76_1711170 [compost metagenome]
MAVSRASKVVIGESRGKKKERHYKQQRPASGPLSALPSVDQLSAARTLAVIASTEPTPSIWLYFGLPPLAADSFW